VLGGEGEGLRDRVCEAEGDGEGVGGEGGADSLRGEVRVVDF
jgi:hypothetical protein